MAINPLAASNAYQTQQKMMQGASGDGTDDSAAAGGDSFASMVKDAFNSFADTQNKAESMQMQSLTGGKVELSDLVTAVTNAELSLNTVVAVRDRVINAYNDIIKMAI